MATSVASKRVPSSSGSLACEGVTRERQGLGVGGLFGEDGEGVGFWRGWVCSAGESWRRGKKSLMSWFSRLREPLEVRTEMRASGGFLLEGSYFLGGGWVSRCVGLFSVSSSL